MAQPASSADADGGGASGAAATVIPAQLGFLAIYNPSLGTTDETVEDQIVYYAGGGSWGSSGKSPIGGGSGGGGLHAAHAARRRRSSASAAAPTAHLAPDERNERLRQIGLAQGMVAFGRSFAGDQAVDTIETDKTRVVLHELEPGWWLLASVDLTRLPLPGGDCEYSAREVKPAALLLQDLLRAHSIFLLHHEVSLAALFARVTPRTRFTVLLARYWDVFLSSWSVLLHGNPVRDVLPGLRVAACGELGVGVGEEDRGSGEREVLEGLVEQTPELVDLVVCKYGESTESGEPLEGDEPAEDGDGKGSSRWLGTGSGLGAEDGAIFLGVGALSRPSLRDLTYWMEDVYSWGTDAYGIVDNPSAPNRQAKRRKKTTPAMGSIHEQQQPAMGPPPPLLPPPPVTQLARRTKQATPKPIPTPSSSSSSKTKKNVSAEDANASPSLSESAGSGTMDKYMSYMKFGYGTYWSLGGSHSESNTNDGSSDTAHGPDTTQPDSSHTAPTRAAGDNTKPKKPPKPRGAAGHFLIGLVDEADNAKAKAAGDVDQNKPAGESDPKKQNDPRGVPRTVVVGLASKKTSPSPSQNALPGSQENRGDSIDADTHRDEQQPEEGENEIKTERLRLVVYAQRPFLCTFLFQLPAESPEANNRAEEEKDIQTLLSRQISVLHKALLNSTTYRPDRPGVASTSSSSSPSSASGTIFDLIWDPNTLTIHSTIPNIPDPGMGPVNSSGGKAATTGLLKKAAKQQLQQKLPPWSRVEALNTHMQILNLYAATRANGAELERMCKTSRGWWIVWNRIVQRTGHHTIAAGRLGEGKYGSTLFEEDEEQDEDDAGGRSGSRDSRRSDIDSDGSGDTATAREAATAAAALSDYMVSKEIFLIRRASDYVDNDGLGKASSAVRAFSASSYLGLGGGGGRAPARGGTTGGDAAGSDSGAGWADGASRLAQGIGVDTKKYIEGLLNLNR